MEEKQENHKLQAKEVDSGDVMHKGPPPTFAIGVVPLLLIVTLLALFLLPVSPFISGTFTIQTTGGHADIKILGVSYSKQSFLKGLSAPDGNLILTVKPAAIGTYNLTIEVRYGDPYRLPWPELILSRSFDNIGDGTYGFEALFLYRQESTGIPYIITIRVSGMYIPTTEVNFIVSPS